nr:PREDICTED: T-box transcription factor TBX15 [Latimeria chalumnae]|eukprot:XP_014344889.1 PREDICTED: T-box transcription factor TBX15 [Latimeria chalumnae]
MSERRRSAAALSSRAHAFSVEALIGTNKKRKLRGWEEKGLDLSMENFSPNGQLGESEDPTQCLDLNPDSEPSTGSDTEGLVERTSCSFSSHSDLTPAPSDHSPPSSSASSSSSSSSSMDEIQVELQCADLWKRFHDIGTEMIITKAGRRMFPAMRVKITGLDPHQQYYIAMDIIPVDNKRYRYVYHSSKWMVAGNADSPVPPRVYIHPDSLASGDTWMRQVVSFDKLKLTNNELDDQGHIILHSMHKYQPRVHVIRKDNSGDLSPTKPVPVGEGVKTFNFLETVFTTVTAYQNQQGSKVVLFQLAWINQKEELDYEEAECCLNTATSNSYQAQKGEYENNEIKLSGFFFFNAQRIWIGRYFPSKLYTFIFDLLSLHRTGLEAIMETYAFWRPPVRTLTFEDFTNMQKQQVAGGSTGTSPTTSSTGTPSPSASSHLLSPSCSPPTFHLAPNTFNVACRESQLCNLNLSEYPACARSNMAALQSYPGLSDNGYNRLQGGNASATQPSESFMPQRTPSLISGMPTPPSLPGNNKMDAYGGQLGSFSASQFQYVMQAGNPGSSSSSPHMFSGGHMQQSSYNAFSLHNPYNLYGYNFPGSPRLAASPEKLSTSQSTLLCSSSPNGAFGDRQYLSSGMDGMHMVSNPSTVQPSPNSCDTRQYGTVPGSSSQMSVHMV